jgi:hypothetical protein
MNDEPLWNLFFSQSKLNTIEGSTDMLEDLAAKGILEGHCDHDIKKAIGQYYRQCEEICQKKLNQGKEVARNFANKYGLTIPQNRLN